MWQPATDYGSAPEATPKVCAPPALRGCQTPAIPTHCAEDLTGAENMAHIRLNDMVYTLRITRAGKLILTK